MRLHFTFLLFLAWLGYARGLSGFALVVALFLCVVLHEFGHALTARRYGIETRDITLYPIGGVAMLTGRIRPRHELWVALAGPAVNVVLAAIFGAVLLATGKMDETSLANTFLGNLFMLNVVMAAFNMLPAFPMDGGRVLRALLARKLPIEKATRIAAHIGQAIAIAFFLAGLLNGNVVWTFVALFVFLGAGQESQAETTRSYLTGYRARDAMQTRYRTLAHGASLETAAQMLLAGSQTDFPVVAEDEVVGLLSRDDIARGLAQDGPDAYVAGHMRRDAKTAPPDAPLDAVVEMFAKDDPSPVLVFEDGRLVGMVTTENVGEFLLLQHARRARAA